MKSRLRRRRRQTALLLFPFFVVPSACDAYARTWGRVMTPDQRPIPSASVRVKGGSPHLWLVDSNGEFDVSTVGKTTWLFEAAGFRSAEKTLKAPGRYRCRVELVPVDSGKESTSKVTCESL